MLSGCTGREGQLGMRCWMKTWREGAASVVAGVLCPRTVEKGETDRGKRSGLGWEEGEVPHVNLRTLSRTEWRPCLCISGVWNPDLSRTLWQQALGGSHLVPQRRAPGMAVLGRRGSAGGRAHTHDTSSGQCPHPARTPVPNHAPCPHAGLGGPGPLGRARLLGEPGPRTARAPRPVPTRRARAQAPAPAPAAGGGGDCFCCR